MTVRTPLTSNEPLPTAGSCSSEARRAGASRSGRTTFCDNRPDFPIAIVEAKARYKHAAEGLQQAKDYAEILGLRFAYATNGEGIVGV